MNLSAVTAGRKLLIPLFKRLHPDLMRLELPSVRQQNLNCIQNINDLWDTIECNAKSISKDPLTKSHVDILVPFRGSYDLSCYLSIAARNGHDDPVKIRESDKNTLILKTPDALCHRHSLSIGTFERNVNTILSQQGKLLTIAGMLNPWEAHTRYRKHRQHNIDPQRRVLPQGSNLEQRLHMRLMEKIARKHRRVLAIRSILDEATRITGNKPEAILGVGQDVINRAATTKLEVDYYIRRGNFLVLNTSPAEELRAVANLREFLIKHAEVLQFDAERWHSVVFVIEQHLPVSIKHGDIYRDFDVGRRSSFLVKGYNLERMGECFIVTVPHNLKPRLLLKFLKSYLPVAKATLFNTL